VSRRRSVDALLVLPTGVRRESQGWHRPDLKVRWGSVTKVLTAGLAHAAVERGDLAWETTVGEVLGGGSSITVAELVRHRSGLPRTAPGQGRELLDPYRRWTRARFDADVVPTLDSLVDRHRRVVGEYSNLGYAVLTRLLEEVARPWIDQVRAVLVEPAGLRPDIVDVARATGERDDVVEALSVWGRPLDEWAIGDGPFVGAAGLLATLDDVATLVRAHVGGGVLDPRRQPHAWHLEDGVAVHQGALMRCGAVLAHRPDTGSLGVASAVGGRAAFADRAAAAALERLVSAQVGRG
jgi:CubicO group peptidase (beta-lactamase class C family)